MFPNNTDYKASVVLNLYSICKTSLGDQHKKIFEPAINCLYEKQTNCYNNAIKELSDNTTMQSVKTLYTECSNQLGTDCIIGKLEDPDRPANNHINQLLQRYYSCYSCNTADEVNVLLCVIGANSCYEIIKPSD